MDETRLNLAKRKLVKGEEFMTLLAKIEPLFKEKEDAYTSWLERNSMYSTHMYANTIIGMKRHHLAKNGKSFSLQTKVETEKKKRAKKAGKEKRKNEFVSYILYVYCKSV